jgi:siroheme synthase-like protein
MTYYPVYLDLRFRLSLVVGGDGAAEAKVEGLLASGSCVRLVAPEITEGLVRRARNGEVEHHPRAFREQDLEGVSLAISVLPPEHAAVNQRLWQEARRRNVPVNVMDDVPRCTFIAPSIVRRGDLCVAISTAGSAPALAVRLRQRLERELGDEHRRFLDLARTVRAPLARRFPSFGERKERWYRLVDSDVLELLRQGEERRARDRFEEILGVAPEGEPRATPARGEGLL